MDAKGQDIAAPPQISLALGADLAGLARPRLAVESDIIVIGNRLGADEALLEVGVDDAGRARRTRAFLHRPGARLFGARGEKRDETKKIIAGANKPVQPGFGKAETFKIFVAVLWRQLSQLFLDASRDRDGS